MAEAQTISDDPWMDEARRCDALVKHYNRMAKQEPEGSVWTSIWLGCADKHKARSKHLRSVSKDYHARQKERVAA